MDLALLVPLPDVGQDLGLDEGAGGLLDEALFIGQREVHHDWAVPRDESIATLGVGVAILPPRQAVKMAAMDEDALRAWLDHQTADHEFSGVALVWRDGRPVFSYAGGLAHRGHGVAVTWRTRFAVASVTKLVTATAALRLVERGLVRLDQPLIDVLPAESTAGRHDIRAPPSITCCRTPLGSPTTTTTATRAGQSFSACWDRTPDLSRPPCRPTCCRCSPTVPADLGPGHGVPLHRRELRPGRAGHRGGHRSRLRRRRRRRGAGGRPAWSTRGSMPSTRSPPASPPAMSRATTRTRPGPRTRSPFRSP